MTEGINVHNIRILNDYMLTIQHNPSDRKSPIIQKGTDTNYGTNYEREHRLMVIQCDRVLLYTALPFTHAHTQLSSIARDHDDDDGLHETSDRHEVLYDYTNRYNRARVLVFDKNKRSKHRPLSR